MSSQEGVCGEIKGCVYENYSVALSLAVEWRGNSDRQDDGVAQDVCIQVGSHTLALSLSHTHNNVRTVGEVEQECV